MFKNILIALFISTGLLVNTFSDNNGIKNQNKSSANPNPPFGIGNIYE